MASPREACKVAAGWSLCGLRGQSSRRQAGRPARLAGSEPSCQRAESQWARTTAQATKAPTRSAVRDKQAKQSMQNCKRPKKDMAPHCARHVSSHEPLPATHGFSRVFGKQRRMGWGTPLERSLRPTGSLSPSEVHLSSEAGHSSTPAV